MAGGGSCPGASVGDGLSDKVVGKTRSERAPQRCLVAGFHSSRSERRRLYGRAGSRAFLVPAVGRILLDPGFWLRPDATSRGLAPQGAGRRAGPGGGWRRLVLAEKLRVEERPRSVRRDSPDVAQLRAAPPCAGHDLPASR